MRLIVILDMDVGNSRLKWRFTGMDGEILGAGSYFGEIGLAQPVIGAGITIPPERVRIANVRGERAGAILREVCQSCWGVVPEFAVCEQHCAGVTNAYVVPDALGIDRWLAILAAYDVSRAACCVVDAGSAVTFDAVAADGQHLGGYIVPGLRLQKRSLLEGTQIQMPDSETWSVEARPGKNTREAVYGGILAMLVDWIQYEFQKVAACSNAILYLSGGDAEVLSEQLVLRGIAHRVIPDLVLDGLAKALP